MALSPWNKPAPSPCVSTTLPLCHPPAAEGRVPQPSSQRSSRQPLLRAGIAQLRLCHQRRAAPYKLEKGWKENFKRKAHTIYYSSPIVTRQYFKVLTTVFFDLRFWGFVFACCRVTFKPSQCPFPISLPVPGYVPTTSRWSSSQGEMPGWSLAAHTLAWASGRMQAIAEGLAWLDASQEPSLWPQEGNPVCSPQMGLNKRGTREPPQNLPGLHSKAPRQYWLALQLRGLHIQCRGWGRDEAEQIVPVDFTNLTKQVCFSPTFHFWVSFLNVPPLNAFNVNFP